MGGEILMSLVTVWIRYEKTPTSAFTISALKLQANDQDYLLTNNL